MSDNMIGKMANAFKRVEVGPVKIFSIHKVNETKEEAADEQKYFNKMDRWFNQCSGIHGIHWGD